MENNLILFEGKNIRRIPHEGDMYFSVIDIIEVLTDSLNPNRYWTDLKRRSEKESGQLYAFCVKLKFLAPDGKMRPTDCANTEGVLRIIQSIPSPKAEPFRMWMADLGKQAIQEAADPELMTQRQADIYRAKGYPEDWIGERLKTIDIRRELTDEWKNRGVEEGQEYSILTATIAKSTFGLTPTEHGQLKNLDKHNLRDHMTRMELILTALSEEATRAITVDNDAQGFHENHDAATKGGNVGRVARENFEKVTGRKVVSAENFLNLKAADETTALPTESPKSE